MPHPFRFFIDALAAAVLATMLVVPADAGQYETNSTEALNSTRACTPKPGNAAKITTTTGASAAFAVLNPNVVYWLRCSSEVYLATGATSPTATSNNFPLPPSLIAIRTNDSVKYLAARAVTTGGSCWVWECN